MDIAAKPLIQSYALDLVEVPAGDRVHAWRRGFVRYYDMPAVAPDFQAKGRAFDLGKAVLSDTLLPNGLTLMRDKQRTRRDGADNIVVSTELAGGFRMETEFGQEEIGAGHVTLFDVARPAIKQTRPGRTLALALARELVEDALPGVDVHALTLRSGGALLAEHLRTLRSHVASIQLAAAPHLVRATVAMLAACVLPTAEHLERARPVITSALLTRARRYIRAQCQNPRLTPEIVAAAVGASRTSLYRAFEPLGGVADFIRTTRLQAARFALQNPGNTQRIGEIAFAYGFSSEAQFSRAMRAAFGATPSDIRQDQGGFPVRSAKEKWLQGMDALFRTETA